MLGYKDFIEEERDACDVFEEQQQYLVALGLTNACVQIGK